MLKRFTPCLLALLLSVTGGFAEFEGTLVMKMSLVSKDGKQRGNGTLNIALAKAGMRGEVNLSMERGAGMKSIVLCKTETPNLNYVLTEADKTYSVVDVSQPAATGGSAHGQPTWTVEKLGRQKILGYKTQHIMAKSTLEEGKTMELWIATDFLDFDTYRKLQNCSGGSTGDDCGLNEALKAAGAEGMPLKAVITTPEGDRVKMEVVKTEKKSLPASTFEIPAGYTQSVGRRGWRSR